MSQSLTQEEFAAKLQLAGLHSIDRVTVAKIESQIRSVFDFEMALLAQTLKVEMSDLMPSVKTFKDDLKLLTKEKS